MDIGAQHQGKDDGKDLKSGPVANEAMAAAVSEDGIRFTIEQERTFSYQSITDPDVFRTGNAWTMLVSVGATLIRTTSDDGLTFTYQNSMQLGGTVSSTAIINGQLTTFYCSSGGIAAATVNSPTGASSGIKPPPPADKP